MQWTVVGTETILLGLIREDSGLAANALKKHGLSVEILREEVEKILGFGLGPVVLEIPFTARAKRVLTHSWNVSEKSNAKVIGTGHILLGLVLEAQESENEEEQSGAYRVLKNTGVSLSKLYDDVVAMIEQDVSPTSARAKGPSYLESLGITLPQTIAVFESAQEEARVVGQSFVGTEQLLLGVIAQSDCVSSELLRSFGVSMERARVEIENIIGRGYSFVPAEIPLTPRAKRALELSWTEARERGQNYIGTEHLLLGLIREGSGVAVKVLENMGVKPELLRQKLLEKMGNAT
jgi:ATP-dependent Clp protease ATP-binding subunit ClpA